jgi:hypothetical protein
MDYYISNNDGRYSGPFKKEQLIAAGLDLDTMVWRQGMAAWTPAKLLPELSDIIADVPPPMEITLGPSIVQPQPIQQPVQQEVAYSDDTNAKIRMQLEQLNKEKDELKKLLEQKKAEGDKKLVAARAQHQAEIKEQKKQKEKEAKKKTKYDYPVCDWRNESIWLLVFVICHAAMAIAGWTTFFYLYIDILGAVLSIIGIVIGCKIRELNKISYKKGSESRLKAEPLGYYNGILVSATAAIGFLIILVQSAYYVYIC